MCGEGEPEAPQAWLEENLHWLREERPDILDPHHCQHSCLEPGLGCEACTDPSYFPCVRNNVSVCLHPDLVCDSHPHCDQAEDEDITDYFCYDKLLRKGRIREDATIQCKSKMYPSKYYHNTTYPTQNLKTCPLTDMMTVATACDGESECDGDFDENFVCDWKAYLVYGVVSGSMAAIFMILLVMKYYETTDIIFQDFGLRIIFQLMKIPDLEDFMKQHDDEEFKANNNMILLRNKMFANKESKREQCIKFYDNEMAFHAGDVAAARCCMKNSLHLYVFNFVNGEKFAGYLADHHLAEKARQSLDQLNWVLWTIKKVKHIFSAYFDILTDVSVLLILLATVGFKSLWNYPTKLTSVVIFCLIASIFCPLWLCCFLNVKEDFKREKPGSFKRKAAIYCKTFLFAFFKPMLILNSYEANKQEIKAALVKRKDKKHILELLKNGQHLKIQYVNFIRIDIGLGRF